MPAADNNEDEFKYCDANAVGGYWCPEFDIMEANMYGFQTTGHTCDAPTDGVYDNCDTAGQCTTNFLTNATDNDYGPGSDYLIDTTQPFHVKL